MKAMIVIRFREMMNGGKCAGRLKINKKKHFDFCAIEIGLKEKKVDSFTIISFL
ncbi:hypothetical protein Hanom_Chr01g00089681 [Helianthus anomalus]